MSDPIDPREMRKLIMNYAHGRASLDGTRAWPTECDAAKSLVRNVLQAAQFNGLSGEDAMTMLAFHALTSLAEANKRLLDMISVTPTQPLSVRELSERVHIAVRDGKPIDLS